MRYLCQKVESSALINNPTQVGRCQGLRIDHLQADSQCSKLGVRTDVYVSELLSITRCMLGQIMVASRVTVCLYMGMDSITEIRTNALALVQ